MRRLALAPLAAVVLTVLVVAFAARSAQAGPVDPRTLRDELEDRVLDRDLDAEDLVGLRTVAPRALGGAARGSAWVSVAAFAELHEARRDVGGLVVLSLPLDRVAAPGPVVGPAATFLAEPLAEPAASAPAPGPHPGISAASAAAIALSPKAARACVAAALRAAGLDDDDRRVDGAVARARASAALPEVRLRAVRTTDDTLRLAPTETDPYRYSSSGGVGETYELRLTFRLDRLLFADEETSLERLRMDRVEARARLAGRVLAALFEWQRAQVLEADPALPSQEHLAAVLRSLEAEATLDVMTAGWFSRWRADER